MENEVLFKLSILVYAILGLGIYGAIGVTFFGLCKKYKFFWQYKQDVFIYITWPLWLIALPIISIGKQLIKIGEKISDLLKS